MIRWRLPSAPIETRGPQAFGKDDAVAQARALAGSLATGRPVELDA